MPTSYAFPAMDLHYHSWEHHSPPFPTTSTRIATADQPSVLPGTQRSARTSSDIARSGSYVHPFLVGHRYASITLEMFLITYLFYCNYLLCVIVLNVAYLFRARFLWQVNKNKKEFLFCPYGQKKFRNLENVIDNGLPAILIYGLATFSQIKHLVENTVFQRKIVPTFSF